MTDLKDYKDVLPQKIIEDTKKAFAEFNLTETQKQKAIEKIVLLYNKSRYEPGEAVGVVTAQSVSEPGTQMSMRSYHLAGTVEIKVTQGLPRLIEIFDARKEPQTPLMTIHLLKSWNSKEKAKQIVSEIQETTLGSIMESAFVDILNMQVEYAFDDKKLRSFGLNLSKIFDIMKEIKTVEAKLKTYSITIKPKNEEASIKDLQKLKTKLLETHIKGIKGITQAIISEEENEWVIKTLGTNLAKILAFEGVDASRTTTNDIHEVAKVLGIEAARAAIVREALATLGGQGLDVDVRHILLIADVMTVDGIIRPIGRYGVAGSKGSLLARANFEETIKHLTNGSLAGETDKLESIVENVMINQVVPIGTGMFDLVFSPKKIEKAKE
ncbi:DNA-directed RNA polymerase subunit A'' [archaeon]|nr:MAG: DNA-directed RNA polymerase subunit A'' [archaeon]